MRKLILTLVAILTCIAASAATYTVTVVYNGSTATVSIPSAISGYVTNVTEGSSSHVKLLQTSTTDKNPGEIIYNLSGSSDNGEFYMTGDYKATLQLNALTLNNPDSTAIHIKNGKRIKVSMVANTVSTLSDGTLDDESKGCFHSKGHTEFVGRGTLNISSSIRHAIYSKEYVTIKNCTLNITGARKDGIHCQEYFLMTSGIVNISGCEDDGIQVELKGTESTGTTKDHEDEDSGNFYMTGGTLTISDIADGRYCIKADGTISLSAGTRNFDTENMLNDALSISSVTIDTSGGRLVYDLNGRRMPDNALLPKGIYIVRERDKVSKVLVK